jgi:hypothetical protein
MMASKEKKKLLETVVHVRFAADLLHQIDSRADVESRTRANMIQVLVKQALEVRRDA